MKGQESKLTEHDGIPDEHAREEHVLEAATTPPLRKLVGVRDISLMRNPPPPQDPTVGLSLGPYGGSGGGGVSYERVTPVDSGPAPSGRAPRARDLLPLYRFSLGGCEGHGPRWCCRPRRAHRRPPVCPTRNVIPLNNKPHTPHTTTVLPTKTRARNMYWKASAHSLSRIGWSSGHLAHKKHALP